MNISFQYEFNIGGPDKLAWIQWVLHECSVSVTLSHRDQSVTNWRSIWRIAVSKASCHVTIIHSCRAYGSHASSSVASNRKVMIHNTDIYVITSIWASQIRNFKYFYFIITLPATLKLWELTNFGQGVFRVSCKNIASHADNLWFYQFWNWTIKIVSINCALVFCDWLIWLVVASDHNVLHN